MWYKAGDEEAGWRDGVFTHGALSLLLSGMKGRHAVALLAHTKASYLHVFLYPSCRTKRTRGGRKPSEWRARGARRESERDTNIYTQESAVSEWIWGGVGGGTLPSCPPFEVRHRPYVQSPREGHVYIPPSVPTGLANGSDPSSEEREELPRSAPHRHHSDCVEHHKKKKKKGHRPV